MLLPRGMPAAAPNALAATPASKVSGARLKSRLLMVTSFAPRCSMPVHRAALEDTRVSDAGVVSTRVILGCVAHG